MRSSHVLCVVLAVLSVDAAGRVALAAADAPSVKLALSFQPVHGASVAQPKPEEYDRCKVEVERTGKASGWVVTGPNGEVVRRFIDTNGDNVVDQWRYYDLGMEVYRDVDTDFNSKVDQSRWMNTAGLRWAIDRNEDGKIDAWKSLSAEELSREAVIGLARQDAAHIKTLLLTAKDITDLGIKEPFAGKLRESVADPEEKLKSLANSALVTKELEWSRFDAAFPGLIPSEDGKADQDVMVYENVMAIVHNGDKRGFIYLGEIIKVGDVWKVTQVPQPMEGETIRVTEGGILIQPPAAGSPETTAGTASVNPEVRKLLEQLQELDQKSPSYTAGKDVLQKYNRQRVALLDQLIQVSQTPEERAQWTRQLVDGLTAAVQTGSYPEGLQKLEEVARKVGNGSEADELTPYIAYRQLLAEYSHRIQSSSSDDLPKVQEWWLKGLEEYVEKHSKAADAGDAMLQLAVTLEFSGNIGDAQKWYGRLVGEYRDSGVGERAAGAMRRLNAKGRSIELAGDSLAGQGRIDTQKYQGRVLLVYYWASWCKPCTEDLPQIIALHKEYRQDGFEVLGVNLDSTPAEGRAFAQQFQTPWNHIYEPGGLESPPAEHFGIISLPTMFIVDRNGEIVANNATVADLRTMLPDLLRKKK